MKHCKSIQKSLISLFTSYLLITVSQFKCICDSCLKTSDRWGLLTFHAHHCVLTVRCEDVFGSGSSQVGRSRPSAAAQPVTPADFDVRSNTTHRENWICPFITAAAHAELIRFWQNFMEKMNFTVFQYYNLAFRILWRFPRGWQLINFSFISKTVLVLFIKRKMWLLQPSVFWWRRRHVKNLQKREARLLLSSMFTLLAGFLSQSHAYAGVSRASSLPH